MNIHGSSIWVRACNVVMPNYLSTIYHNFSNKLSKKSKHLNNITFIVISVLNLNLKSESNISSETYWTDLKFSNVF